MAAQLDLLKAIRAGDLKEVVRALDAGALPDDPQGGEPGLPMGIACFLGHVDIVAELVRRGAVVNLADNSLPTSPLSMAVRGKRNEVVRALIHMGAQVPDGMATGLSEHEIMLAKWIAFRDGHGEERPPNEPVFDEIVLKGRADTDTLVLEAEMLKAIEAER
jgi:ankyrin repeat protein